MQRYFINDEQWFGEEVHLLAEDAHHLSRVMRARLGDQIICSNGENREVLAEVVKIEKDAVLAKIVRELTMSSEPSVHITIAQSLPKGDKMEWIIQKCTEIGAMQFVPFTSSRTVVQYDAKKLVNRTERWRKIAKEAAEQAHRNRVPRIEQAKTWSELWLTAKEADAILFCYEHEKGNGNDIKTVLQSLSLAQPDIKDLWIVIGPEGGFTDEEASLAEQSGAHVIGLGKRILRTETAAMFALTCALYELGDVHQ